MDLILILQAILLGVVEGATEFLPISSTGHLILFRDIIGFKGPPGFVFEVAIQLGAILAICWKYRRRITVVTLTLHRPESRKFAFIILLAFLPAMVIGFFAHGFIKTHLFDPMVVGIALFIGGFVIIIIENLCKEDKFETVDDISYMTALKVGFFQCIAMIPGVSRSGATIMGSRVLGVSRQAATEFSFFLAIPTMFAATVYDLYKNWTMLELGSLGIIAIGFVSAFVTALFVVNIAVNFISKNGFKPFAYYRIVAGTIIIVALY